MSDEGEFVVSGWRGLCPNTCGSHSHYHSPIPSSPHPTTTIPYHGTQGLQIIFFLVVVGSRLWICMGMADGDDDVLEKGCVSGIVF
jgi:hypothetical protein